MPAMTLDATSAKGPTMGALASTSIACMPPLARIRSTSPVTLFLCGDGAQDA